MQLPSSASRSRKLVVPDLDLPILPEIARRPPVLTMDQYFLWNDAEFRMETPPPSSPLDKCAVPFEL
jgi:hypothetical protein